VPLTGRQKAHLRALAHPLSPVVLVGDAGLSDAVVAKIAVELERHELIKVKIAEGADAMREAAEPVALSTGAEVVQTIGKTLVLYKAHPKDPQIQLPSAEPAATRKAARKAPAKRAPTKRSPAPRSKPRR
jgi:RNA-binding protein